MKFSISNRNTSFEEPTNYFPHPGYYTQLDTSDSSKELKTSFSQAPRFRYEDGSRQQQIPPLDNNILSKTNLMHKLMPDLYPNNKRQVFKSTLKNVKNSIEKNEEYGEGLSQLLEQYSQKKNQETSFPGPGYYNPSLEQVTKKPLVTLFGSNSKKISNASFEDSTKDTQQDSIQTTQLNTSQTLPQIAKEKPHLQILVGNGETKLALIDNEENKLFEEARLFASRAPKYGELKRSKICKNVFDLAKEDAFDPSPEASCIELYLLRQKQLGPSEIPPPGFYYNEQKNSTFNLKQVSAKNTHFNSSTKRLFNFSTQSDAEVEKQSTGPINMHEQLLMKRKKQYLQTLPKLTIDMMIHNQDTQNSDNDMSQGSSKHFYVNQDSKRINQTTNNATQAKTKGRTTFGGTKKISIFEGIAKAELPGPGAYNQNIYEVKTAADPTGKQIAYHNTQVFFSPVFGSGSIRFPSMNPI